VATFAEIINFNHTISTKVKITVIGPAHLLLITNIISLSFIDILIIKDRIALCRTSWSILLRMPIISL